MNMKHASGRTVKRAMLCALTAALVFGYLGVFEGDSQAAPIQTFADAGAAAVSVDHCYDTVAANTPVLVADRVVCNPANLTTLPVSTPVYAWTVVNIPIGNRLTLPTTFTPVGPGQWSPAAVACTPDANNRCTENGGAGTTDGWITARTDLSCNQVIDVVASGGAGAAVTGWPNNSAWTPPVFGRIAASPGLGGGGSLMAGDIDSYIHSAVPFPAAWGFRSADLARLPFVYLGGTAPFAVTPSLKLVNLTYEYGPVAAVSVSTTLLGGSPDNPPDDNLAMCFDSPLDSITQSDALITPSLDDRIPRWTLLQSAADLGDASANRIVDWQCDVIGIPGGVDADGDCLEDGSDPNPASKDADGDLVPDGVEVFSGSNPNDLDGDTDNDGAKDYDELFQFTNPTLADTDGDGQADKQDVIPTNATVLPSAACLNPEIGSAGGGACAATGGLGLDQFDATDDNCPSRSNASQLNTDSLWQYHGMGGNTTTTYTSTGDRTNPDEDLWGDACDADDDNDDLPDATEAVMRIRDWSGNQDDTVANGGTDPEGEGDGTTLCAGPAVIPGTHAPIRVMSPVMGDVDMDYVLDGMECILRSRPDAAIRIAGVTNEAQYCSAGAVAVITGMKGGCAQPAGAFTTCTPMGAASLPSPRCNGSAGTDADSDALNFPFGGAPGHLAIEVFYRTRQINIATGVQLNDIDGDGLAGELDNDSDRDTRGFTGTAAGMKDGVEVRFYGIDPSAADTDGDGCEDGDEWTDISGDGVQNIADTGLRMRAGGGHDVSPSDGQIDAGRYFFGANRDFNKDGTNAIADSGILAAAVAVGGSCPPEGGAPAFPAQRATRHLP